MPLKLHAPGSRKANRFWIARGRVAGRLYEISTRELDKAGAERVAARFVVELLERRGGGAAPRSFAAAADAYVAWRKPDARDEDRLARLCAELGRLDVAAIGQAEIVHAVQAAWPGRSAASWNRNGIAPAAAVLHYAASNRWCEYRRIARFRESAPRPRALAAGDARKLIAAARPGPERLLLLLLFGLGSRITDTLGLDWGDIELRAGVVNMRVSKTARVVALPLPRELVTELGRVRPAARQGAVLPYGNRWRAYKACAAVAARAGVAWTPHQARHTLGTELARSGATLRAIMAALGHANVKSSMRYQAADLELVRAAQDHVGLLGRRRRQA